MEPPRIKRHPFPVWTLAWSPDGTRLASADRDGAIHLWDTANGRHLLTYGLHRQRVSVLAWSPDGRRIAELVTGDRVLFAEVADLLDPSATLEATILHTLAQTMRPPSAEDERLLAQAEVLQPGRALPRVIALAEVETKWVVDQVEAIVGGTPEAGIALLRSLDFRGDALKKLGRRIAPLAVRDPNFLPELDQMPMPPHIKQAILAAARP